MTNPLVGSYFKIVPGNRLAAGHADEFGDHQKFSSDS
jgi:hypothetical protein